MRSFRNKLKRSPFHLFRHTWLLWFTTYSKPPMKWATTSFEMFLTWIPLRWEVFKTISYQLIPIHREGSPPCGVVGQTKTLINDLRECGPAGPSDACYLWSQLSNKNSLRYRLVFEQMLTLSIHVMPIGKATKIQFITRKLGVFKGD